MCYCGVRKELPNMGLKKRTTVKCGPSKRNKKALRVEDVDFEYERLLSLSKAFLRISNRKGYSSEDRFEQVFKGDFQKPFWYAGIRRASKFQDHNEGTDFFIQTKNYGEIRFDVKSSFWHYKKQVEFQGEVDIFVWCIVVNPQLTDHQIRQLVFSKCEIHIVRFKREVRMGRIPARTA